MRMPAKKNNAVMLSAALALAACGKAEKPIAAAAPAQIVQVAAIDAHTPTVVERRHFAIYSTYRVLFDDSSNASKSPAEGEEGEGHAVADLDRSMSTCSIQDLQPAD